MKVVKCEFDERRKQQRRGDEDKQRWLWRQAVQIVGLLPENETEARAVLDYCEQLLRAAPNAVTQRS